MARDLVLQEERDNAAIVASGVHKESWRIGAEPMVASPCRCETPAHCRDEQLGIKCVKCGRRPRIARAVLDPLTEPRSD